ncbi:hypothetical protein [Pseudomonas sp. 'CRE Jenny 4']|uniref:hypothetical protein n=1 Tax=Pseudomonas sp. 'CRE Jenny 4' TaxID=3045817 RepID=UPI0025A202F9|nr:hypothetical protein [Pseudomonas sp. 'CRE Jenny 4']
MTIFEAADIYFANLQPASTLVGVLSGLACFIHYKLDSSRVFECLVRGFAFSTLPNGLAFAFCSAYPLYISKISDSSAAFLLGGLALIFMPFAVTRAVNRFLGQSSPAVD